MKALIILAGFLSSFLILAPAAALAGTSGKAGPHGGMLLGNEKQQLELAFDTGRSSVDVYVLKTQKQLPDSVKLTLLDAAGNRRVFELKALESSSASPPQYHTSLDPSEQSYAGFELKIPFTSEPPAVFKSN